MRFIWDEKKEQSNLKKHGVSFSDAAQIFDERVLTCFDGSDALGEDRYIAIGWAGQRLLAVVFVERGSDLIRLISARKVTPREERLYERGY